MRCYPLPFCNKVGRDGFTLTEVIVSFTIFMIVMLSVITTSIMAQRMGQSARNRLNALQHARASLEELQSEGYGSDRLQPGTHAINRGGLTGRYVVTEVIVNELKRVALSYDYLSFGSTARVELQGVISNALH